MRIGENYAKGFCKNNGYKFIKCFANFYHIDFNFNPRIIQKYLVDNKILVKGGPGYDDGSALKVFLIKKQLH